MSWDDLNIKEKSDLMRLYISNGIMDLDSIKEHYNSFATGGALPDHDPNNPYHYHDAEGNKMVISPEDWEANVGKPYFREIEDAVKAEQAAHPGPEYEINPAFVRDLNSSVAAARGQNGMINYVGYKNQLPQGYTINENGIIFDDKGQAYVQESYPQSTRFTYNADSPLQFTFNQGKPIERNVNFYPVNMDMRVKPPLPVDRILDINVERENAIKTIQDNLVYRTSLENILPGFEGGMMVGNTPLYYDFSSKNNHKEFIKKYLENITGTPVTFIKYNDDYDNIVELDKEQLDTITKNSKLYYDKQDREQIEKIKKDLSKISPNDFRTKEDYDEYINVNNKYIQSLSDYINSSDFYYDYPEDRPKPYKLPRKEAEKKAVIKIGPLEKTKTFEEGGPINNKSDWAKAHEVELTLQQLGWDNPNNKLHSDYAAKDDKGYYAGYRLKPVTITAKHPYHDIWGEESSVPADLNTPEKWQDYKNFVTNVQERPDYKGVQTFMNVAALSPLLPILGPEALSFGKEALLGTAKAYAKPMATAMLGLAGHEGLNNLSLEGTGSTFDYNLARNIVHSEPTSGDILAASFLNPGWYLGGVEPKVLNYTNGVNKRLAEVGLRMGDKLMHTSLKDVPKFLKDNNVRNITSYIFNPKADPKLAYNLGPDFMYNGTEAGSSTIGGYEGDVIDLYLGKNLDKAPYELTNNYPEAISKYTTEKYGIKRPRVYDIGVVDNKANRVQSEAMGIYQYDHPVLDPGGHATYGENDLGTLHYDIWKYNPKEFIQRWGEKEGMSKIKKLLARTAASFIDKRGEPIAHIWTQPWEGTVTTDSPLMGIGDKLGFKLSDKDLNYILQMPMK